VVKVKICGIKKLEDALLAIKLGADAVGFLVGQKHSSTDFISPSLAKDIVSEIPPFCSTVLVTHLSTPEEIVPLAIEIGVSTIQLHGETTPEEAMEIKKRLFNIKTYKAVHVEGKISIDIAKRYVGMTDAILLDSVNKKTDQVGGTGLTHDWSISQEIVKSIELPVILAGGLNPENVSDAIKLVKPFGVDANSGTKGNDGYKDPEKLRLFITRAKFVEF